MAFLFELIRLRIQYLFKRGAFRTLPVVLCLALGCLAPAQQLPWSQRVANSTMRQWPDGRFVAPNTPSKWNYELGILLNGMDATWYNTADGDDYHYIQRSMDQLVAPDGSIPTYNAAAHSLDNIALGRALLLLYRVTQKEKYYKAALLLRN